jgi:hypothetical protein
MASAAMSPTTTEEPSGPSGPSNNQALRTGADAVDTLAAKAGMSQASIMNTVRVIGGAMIGIAVLVVVLNQVFALDSIANSSGPFSGISDQLVTVGSAAMGLLVIGLLVLGANRVMGFFGGGGF